MTWLAWDLAWERALYGERGFFRREAPAAHFRTAVHAGAPLLAAALARLAADHGCRAVVDVGAGRGELLAAFEPAGVPARVPARHGVDVVPRPPGLDPAIGWSTGLAAVPDAAFDGALVIAWELLDDVPAPVVEVADDGLPRLVEVELATGCERLAGPPGDADAAWLARWWPLDGAEPGTRAEVGRPRDDLWGALVRRAGAAGARAVLAVDYAHEAGTRPTAGSLAGFRGGRAVPPVPDGQGDVTAHVALDAVAAAGEAAGAVTVVRTDQRTALQALGVVAPERSPGVGADAAGADLLGVLAARSVVAVVAELLDPGALGGFGWLLQRLG